MLYQVFLLLLSILKGIDGQSCLPINSTGCSPNPIYRSLCCPNAWCNVAASCQPCIPLGSTTACSETAQDSRRCCTGLSCVAQRCVQGVATTTRGPTTTPNCLSVGTLGCNPNPALQPQCCANAYCNAASSCQPCIAFGNITTCSPTAQDSSRCCNNLTCFNGLCLPTAVVPTTTPPTSTTPTTTTAITTTTTATTTSTTASTTTTPTTTITTTTGTTTTTTPTTTTAPCIAFGNMSTCSPTATDASRCCPNLTCFSGLCLPDYIFTTTTTPTPCLTSGGFCVNFPNTPLSCCAGYYCLSGNCAPISTITCQYLENQECVTKQCCDQYTCTNGICTSVIVRKVRRGV